MKTDPRNSGPVGEIPKVTFLIPVYNAMPHLKETISSVFRQTLRNFEAVIINDGSTDGSGEYLDSIKDSRISVIHQGNEGYVAALNRGVAQVKTDYFARLDADDIAKPTRLERQLAFLETHPDVAVVGSRMRYIFLRCREFSVGASGFRFRPEYGPPMKNPPYWDPVKDGETIPHPSATIRRTAFEAVGGYRNIAPSEDIDLWLRLRDAGYKLACLPEVLLLYRVGIKSESNKRFIRQLHLLKFAKYCHECRVMGQEELSPEDYFQKFPLDDEEVDDLQVRLGIRTATGRLLSGQFLSGTAGLIKVLVAHPGKFLAKFRSRK
jgi:glycosyltransferase involved in cell wall biosynthesis